MPLYVKDQEVDRLAERLSALRKVSKTEAVRQALVHELERVESEPTSGRAIWRPAAPGFYDVTVVDADGERAQVRVRIRDRG